MTCAAADDANPRKTRANRIIVIEGMSWSVERRAFGLVRHAEADQSGRGHRHGVERDGNRRAVRVEQRNADQWSDGPGEHRRELITDRESRVPRVRRKELDKERRHSADDQSVTATGDG